MRFLLCFWNNTNCFALCQESKGVSGPGKIYVFRVIYFNMSHKDNKLYYCFDRTSFDRQPTVCMMVVYR